MEKIAKNRNILLLLLSALIIRLILAGSGTLSLDQNTFIAWGRRAVEVGFGNFYGAWSDYLPGYIYILWGLAKLGPVLDISTTILYKLPAIFSDLAVGYLIYFITKKKPKLAFFASAAFLFNPAVLANSTLWGQVDIITSLTTLVAIMFMHIWPVSAVALALGVAVKPQAVVAAPLILALALNKKWSFRKLFRYAFVVATVLIVLFVPFSSGNLSTFIVDRFKATLAQYPYGSIKAFNFWGLLGFWKEDIFGVGAVVLITTNLFILLKRKIAVKKPFHFLAILFLVNFLFTTRMHERHLLPALAPLALAAAGTPILWFIYAGFSITYVANMYYSYQWITQDFLEVFSGPLIKLFIIANLFLFIALVKQTLSPGKAKLLKLLQLIKSVNLKRLEIRDHLSLKQEKYLLILILVFSLAVRLYRLDVPSTDYFDEIYHAFTARQILAGDPKPWHWSSAHPEGFAYEWTHPPLAKEIMAVSMGIFGVSSWAWRLPGALAGVALIYLVYLTAKKLFNSRDVGIFAAFLISLDGLVLTMSRIGTADVYFVTFALAAYYLFLQKRDASSALFLGFAAASKWSTLWFLPIFFVTFILLQRHLRRSLFWFILIVPLIYLASYLPMFTFGYDLTTFWGMQKQMWWYHSGLTATHPYTSAWWSWPLNLRPVYLYQDYKTGFIANIYAIGNPAFFWAWFLAIISALWFFIKQKFVVLLVIVLGYSVLFVPWAMSPRIMFIYHYMPSLPFLSFALAYLTLRYKFLIMPVIVVTAVLFVYFFPHWTGLTVPEWLDKTYYWFPSWR